MKQWLKKVFGGSPTAPVAATPARVRPAANDAMTARLARINTAEARITAAQSKIDELTPKLEEAKRKEAGAAQTLLAKAKLGEDTRQYADAQKRAHDEVVSLSNGLISAQRDLAAANEEKSKA